MIKITPKGARAIACAVLSLLVAATSLFAINNVRSVALLGGGREPYYFGDRSKARVSVMINVYENADVVEKMIDVLAEYGSRATFFVGGCWADDNTETVRRIVSSGNEIGNHGYFHKDLKSADKSVVESEITTAHKLVKGLCGVDMTLFAPPSGSFDANALSIAERLGYKTIMWSKDTVDWRDSDVDLIVKRATENVKNGDFILMHPKPYSLDALKRILAYLKENNFEAVTVSENLNLYG